MSNISLIDSPANLHINLSHKDSSRNASYWQSIAALLKPAKYLDTPGFAGETCIS